MIVREQASGHLCIPQSQHAAVAGQLARAWGNEEFAVPGPHAELCLAAERHDDGMDDFDAEPWLDPETGLPRGFMSMPLQPWLACWGQGPGLVAEDSAYAGLLVCLHGLHLLGYRRIDEDDREARELVERFRREQDELIEELTTEAGRDQELEQFLSPEVVERNRHLLAIWDAISLAVCMPRLPERIEDVPRTDDEAATLEITEIGFADLGEIVIEVDPWPFELREVPLAATGRALERTYEEEDEMRAALAAASAEPLNLTLLPADG